MYRIMKKTLIYSLIMVFLFLLQDCKSEETITNINISKIIKADSTKFVNDLYNRHSIDASKSYYLSKEQYNAINNDNELKKHVIKAITDSIPTLSIVRNLRSYFKDNNKEKLFNNFKTFKEKYDRKEYQMDMYLLYEPNIKKNVVILK